MWPARKRGPGPVPPPLTCARSGATMPPPLPLPLPPPLLRARPGPALRPRRRRLCAPRPSELPPLPPLHCAPPAAPSSRSLLPRSPLPPPPELDSDSAPPRSSGHSLGWAMKTLSLPGYQLHLCLLPTAPSPGTPQRAPKYFPFPSFHVGQRAPSRKSVGDVGNRVEGVCGEASFGGGLSGSTLGILVLCSLTLLARTMGVTHPQLLLWPL